MKKKHTTQSAPARRRLGKGGFFKLRTGFCLALLCATAMQAPAATITVTNTNDSGPGSLRQALADANDGDTINFDVSLKGHTIALTSDELVIDKSITITGPGSDQLAVSVDFQYHFRIFHVMASPTVTIEGLTIGPSLYFYGCGIQNDQATLTINNCAVAGNAGLDSGAGISNGGTLTVNNSSITDNGLEYQGTGAGISSSGTLIINNSIIRGNVSGKGYTDGGGIYSSGMLEITNSTIDGNSVGGSGGGIYNLTVAIITSSTISGNFAGGGYPGPPRPGFGGGISSNGTGATLTISNSTISGNSVLTTDKGPGRGGGIGNSGSLQIANSTISGNSATDGGAICNDAAPLEIANSILNAGDLGENIFNDGGTITSLGYNLSSDNGGGYLNGPGDQINTDPILGPLQDNGGPTFTHALLPGSPAIDTGDPNFTPPPFFDQRGPGFDRVVNGRIDKGSFELQAGPTPTPTATAAATFTPTPTPTATHTPTPTATASFTPTPTATATATATAMFTPTPTATLTPSATGTATATATPSPAVTTNAATNVASFSATLNGSVNPRGSTTTVYFQWGTTTSYGHTTPMQTRTGNTSLPITANISGLSASHLYHFRIVATNGGGTSFGSDRTFTTLSATGPPVVTTNPATNVTTSSARLNGSLDPHGLTTTVYFKWGTTTSYGHTTPVQTQIGNTYRNIIANISGLTTHHTYHFRIVATNSAGTRMGSDLIFNTP
jgi:hypothetical protein